MGQTSSCQASGEKQRVPPEPRKDEPGPNKNVRRGSCVDNRRSSCSVGGDPLNLSTNDCNDDAIRGHLKADKPKIFRIVLTGGPCAGKSTTLTTIQSKLPQKYGIKVYCVPEAATLMVGGGLEWSQADEKMTLSYQLALLRVQLALEDQFYAIAKASGKTSLIVCDRGAMDGRAYCSEEQFNEILSRSGYTLEQLRDDRYDAIVHMVTAAQGAEKFYNFDNPARYESVEEAKVNDDKLRQMYVGHRMIRVFDNSCSFQEKLDRVVDFVGRVCGREYPHHLTRRFLVTKLPKESSLPASTVKIRVTLTILNNSRAEEYLMIMKREQSSQVTIYSYQTIKRKGRESVRSEHRISSREYAGLYAQRDQTRDDIVKDNLSFVYKSVFCELGVFAAPSWAKGLGIMYAECEGSEVTLPPFVTIDREVSGEPILSSFYVSHKAKGHEYADPTRWGSTAPKPSELCVSVGDAGIVGSQSSQDALITPIRGPTVQQPETNGDVQVADVTDQ